MGDLTNTSFICLAKFELADDDWRRFMELLDRPPEVPDGLWDLFAKPSVFE